MPSNPEIQEKEKRLWKGLQAKHLDGVLVSRRSNFAWLTAGGDSHVFLASEAGGESLLLTPNGKYLLAHTMDGERMMDEEVAGQGWELKAYPWFEGRVPTLDAPHARAEPGLRRAGTGNDLAG